MKKKSPGRFQSSDQQPGRERNRDARHWRDHYERNRGRYTVAFENLSSIIVDPGGYFGSLKEFLQKEFRRRTILAVTGVIFLAAAIFLLLAALFFGFLSGFLFLDRLIANPALTSFILAWSALLLFFILAFFALRQFQAVAESRPVPPKRP